MVTHCLSQKPSVSFQAVIERAFREYCPLVLPRVLNTVAFLPPNLTNISNITKRDRPDAWKGEHHNSDTLQSHSSPTANGVELTGPP